MTKVAVFFLMLWVSTVSAQTEALKVFKFKTTGQAIKFLENGTWSKWENKNVPYDVLILLDFPKEKISMYSGLTEHFNIIKTEEIKNTDSSIVTDFTTINDKNEECRFSFVVKKSTPTKPMLIKYYSNYANCYFLKVEE